MKSIPLPPPGCAGPVAPPPAGLAAHWQGRARSVLLQEGVGDGRALLALIATWRAQAQPGQRLWIIAIEPQPVAAADVAPALQPHWPPRTPDLHVRHLGGGVTLHLCLGPLALWLRELVAAVDAFALLGPTPAAARLATPDVIGLAHHTPSPKPLPAPPGRQGWAPCAHVAVIGAGLAGAAAAQALARRGVRVSVLERAAEPATQASGNPAGLFHGVVHAHDGAHAQLLRAAALAAAAHYAPLVASGTVPGAVAGLARLAGEEAGSAGVAGDPSALAARHALPPEWAEPLTAAATAARLGTPVAQGAWWFPGGGWISPPALVRHWLATPGVALRTGSAVTHLERTHTGWLVHTAHGAALAADAVVLAGAHDGLALLERHADTPLAPTGRTRGQVTWLPPGHAMPTPRQPLARGAYALALPDGHWLCGATTQRGDDDAAVRAADHAHNLARAAALFGLPPPAAGVLASAQGRVGWRLTTDDRLPLLGPVPRPAAQRAGARRQEQPRQVPRVPGLCAFTALGSRGLTWAPLLAEQLAAWLLDEPWPLPASLVDAVDAARFVARAARQAGRSN